MNMNSHAAPLLKEARYYNSSSYCPAFTCAAFKSTVYSLRRIFHMPCIQFLSKDTLHSIPTLCSPVYCKTSIKFFETPKMPLQTPAPQKVLNVDKYILHNPHCIVILSYNPSVSSPSDIRFRYLHVEWRRVRSVKKTYTDRLRTSTTIRTTFRAFFQEVLFMPTNVFVCFHVPLSDNIVLKRNFHTRTSFIRFVCLQLTISFYVLTGTLRVSRVLITK